MQSTPDDTRLIDVFGSSDRAACDERAFMLGAVNIAARIDVGPTGFIVQVPHRQAAFAVHHLWQYEQELRRKPALAPPQRIWPNAWVGSLLYIAMMVLVALAVIRGWWGPDAFQRGALDPDAIRAGQWWRAVTALTLHLDIVHLVSNLGAGAAIGYFASRQVGAGHAWLLTLLAATGANLIEGLLGASTHLSVGASTAVFAALGVFSAHAWRLRSPGAASWARRWAPLVAGIALLGLLGSGGGEEGQGAVVTNLVAHALGFVTGAMAGTIAATPAVARMLLRLPQWFSGALALALPALAWLIALGG